MFEMEECGWPADRLHEAIAFISRHRGPIAKTSDVAVLAEAAGFDCERVALRYGTVDRTLSAQGPAIIRAGDEDRFLVVISAGRRNVTLLDLELEEVSVRRDAIVSMLREPVENTRGKAFSRLLETVPPRRRGLLKTSLMMERYGEDEVGECWLLGRSLSESFWRHLLDAGVGRSTVALAVTHLLRYVVFLFAWAVIGRAALAGRAEIAWLAAWILLLLLLTPIHYIAVSLQGLISVACGFVLRQKMMFGSLRLDADQLRLDGAGRHLARVFEGDALESLGRSGGVLAFFAFIEIALAALVLNSGAGGTLHVALLIGWTLLIVPIVVIAQVRHDRLSVARMELSGDLVEKMVGHRTRLIQQARSSWHDDEDIYLDRYGAVSRDVDRSLVWFTVVIPRGWMLLGLLGLIPSIVRGNAPAIAIAISLGGIVFAQQAMMRLALGIPDLVAAVSAWKKIAPLFAAAGKPLERFAALPDGTGGTERTILEGRSLAFRYPRRDEAVLRDCNFRVEYGDKIVLEGRSGAGKSTLAAMLAGLRAPDRGLLLFRGLDRATLGSEGWRRRAVLAPQFHENHVFSESFAFNLLMGRSWPPKAQDWRAAEEICEEIGLGELLSRMPGGLSQMVGETGWRLSHGEQARLFIARALLQDPDLLVLDESFAALDSRTFQRAVDCVTRRSRTVVVIAHP